MIETKEVTLDGMKFQLSSLPALTALRLDKKIVALLLPVMGGADDISLDAEIDLSKCIYYLSESLSNLKDDEFQSLIIDMLSTIIYIPDGKPPVQLSRDVIDTDFRGKLMTIYRLIWEVMGYNNFSPFVVMGGGLGINITGMLQKQTVKQTKSNEQ